MDIKKEISEIKSDIAFLPGNDAINRVLDIIDLLNIRQQQHASLLIKHEYSKPQAELKPCPFCAWCINQNSCSILKRLSEWSEHSCNISKDAGDKMDPLRPHK